MNKFYFLALGLSFSMMGLSQATVNLIPIEDNTIYQDYPDSSSGIGKLYSGANGIGAPRRALMKFDFSSIPVGAIITSVELIVNVDMFSGSVADSFNIYPLTTAFGEGTSLPFGGGGAGAPSIAPDANWTMAMFGSTFWTVPGGDYLPVMLSNSIMSIVNGDKVFLTNPTFVTAVQGWYDTPANNFGIIMIGNEIAAFTARRFGSKDLGTAPVLSVSYMLPSCSTNPTPICQNISVFLDSGGNASIVPSDLDGGSIDNCATTGLVFTASQTSFSCSDISAGGGGGDTLLITGAYDGPLVGGTPKGIELYAVEAITDLSNYGVGSANNGGGTDGEEFTFPAVSVSAGTFIYVTSDSTGFNDFFGFDADYTSGAMLINGDDAIELFKGGSVIDVFGDINVDGTGQPWEYLDGWAYRNDLESTNAGVFNTVNWNYSGPNALDGEMTNASATTPFPLASFIPAISGAVSVTLVVTDGNSNVDSCVAMVTVLDTLAPVADSLSLVDITAECEITSLVPVTATDNCDFSINGVADVILPINTVGTTVVTWTYMDSNGNLITQTQNVIIIDTTAAVPDVALLGDLTDDCEVNAPTSPTATDNCEGTITGTPDVTFPITTVGTTTITWTYDDGNGNTSSQTQTVFINGLDNSVSESGGTITATATGVMYQWIDCFDDSFVVGAINQSFTPITTGDFAVIITDGACSDTSACTNVIVGLSEFAIELGILIYPNPSTGVFTVSFEHSIEASIEIYDMKGSLLKIFPVKQESSIEINVSEFENGAYIMKTVTEGGIAIDRIIKL